VRTRTVQFMEGSIISELGRQPHVESNLIFQDIRNVEEEDIFDIALEYMISKGIVKRYKRKGLTSYEMAA